MGLDSACSLLLWDLLQNRLKSTTSSPAAPIHFTTGPRFGDLCVKNNLSPHGRRRKRRGRRRSVMSLLFQIYRVVRFRERLLSL